MHGRCLFLLLFISSLALLAHCQESGEVPDEPDAEEPDADELEAGEVPDDEPEEETPERHLDPEHVKILHGKIDTDGDGKMTLEEIVAFWKLVRNDMVEKTIDVQMEMMDSDGDKKISHEELVGQYADQFPEDATEEEKLREKQMHDLETSKFEAADTNGDGFLDKQELPGAIYPEAHPEILRLMADHTLQHKDKNGDAKLDASEFWQTEASEHTEELLSDFKKLDKDQDGFLDVKEIEEWETGSFHTANAMHEVFELSGHDKDTGITVEQLHEHLPKLKGSEAEAFFADWAEHHEL